MSPGHENPPVVRATEADGQVNSLVASSRFMRGRTMAPLASIEAIRRRIHSPNRLVGAMDAAHANRRLERLLPKE